MCGGMKTKILLVLALAALSACNTVAGVGEDISETARSVQTWF